MEKGFVLSLSIFVYTIDLELPDSDDNKEFPNSMEKCLVLNLSVCMYAIYNT